MLYAKVVLGLAVEGPFDYRVPAHLSKRIREGMRVWVQFRDRKKLGYVVKVARETSIERVKPVLEVVDDFPALDKDMLSLTRKLSDYYGCSWGEAIETALPLGLRKGRKFASGPEHKRGAGDKYKNQEAILIHTSERDARWDIYLEAVKGTVKDKRSVIVLMPDVNSVLKAKEEISVKTGITPVALYRKESGECEEWLKIKESESSIVIGTRSAIFAPVRRLGLVVIEDEQDTVYKQEQVPHYHAREVAFMRTGIEKAGLILGSASPSLESIFMARKGKIKYAFIPRKGDSPEVKIIDMRKEQRYFRESNAILSRYLQDSIVQSISGGGKALLFLNRRGFATFASCRNCGTVLKCPRCNINLVYHFKGSILNCHYCNFKMQPPDICPNCNAAYIKYAGAGTEKIESDLSRVFPQARIIMMDEQDDRGVGDADIFISTASIFKKTGYSFGLVGVLSIDNSLNRIDFRSTEKTFGLLAGLLTIAREKLIIQTGIPGHYSFRAIENKNADLFYDEELKQRRELEFPPYRHLCLVKVRGKSEARVKEASSRLFDMLHKYSDGNKKVKVVSLNPAHPEKLRGNFYWQILLKAGSALNIAKFLKLHLKNFSHSGIIVTIDIDPL
ncbi:MAG: primosomal protein N' [Candidatus Omnitrophota bacterium]